MRKRTGISVVIALLAGMATGCFAGEPTKDELQARYSKVLRNTKISSIRPSPVKGLYEVTAGPNVFYFNPDGDGLLVFGQIVDKDGKNLTAEVQERVRAEYNKVQEKRTAEILKNLPLEKAVRIGNGPNTIIEFTDPDCPYCRKLDAFLTARNDVTRYVFLFPLDQLHPKARAKSVFILNSKDTGQAFRDVFSGKYDQDGGLSITNADLAKYPSEVKRLIDGMKIGQELGVQGTPMLFVNGSMVNGADTKRISQLLKQ